MNAEEFADQLRELESARHSLMMVTTAFDKHLTSMEAAEKGEMGNVPICCIECGDVIPDGVHRMVKLADGPKSMCKACYTKPPSTEAAEKGEFACSTCGALGDATHTMPWVCRECRASLESGSPSCTEARLRTLGNMVRDIETGLGGLTVDRDRIEARLTSLEANPCAHTDRPHIAGVSEAPDSDEAELARALRHLHDAHKRYPHTPLQATAHLQAEELLTKWDAN